MENAIIIILRKGNDIHEFTSEIAEMMTAWTKWFDQNAIRATNYSFMYYINIELLMNVYQERSIEDLFTYWHTEIYKKQ